MKLKARLNRQAMVGVRIVDQPFPESCWVAVMREAVGDADSGGALTVVGDDL